MKRTLVFLKYRSKADPSRLYTAASFPLDEFDTTSVGSVLKHVINTTHTARWRSSRRRSIEPGDVLTIGRDRYDIVLAGKKLKAVAA